MNIIEACQDDNLFAPWFRDPATWAAWFSFLKLFFGLEGLSVDDLALYRQCTGRNDVPTTNFREAALICGRRAGKSFILALIAVYLAVMVDYSPYLQPGERATVMVIAADRKQARVIFRYISGLLTKIGMLASLIERETNDTIELENVSIEIQTASFKTVRGYTIAAVLADEIAFWDFEGANPDKEILSAIKPAMATIPTSVLLLASSPYARRGALWETYQRHFAKDGDPVLVWQADTRTMNPSVPQSFVDKQYDADPTSAAAEFGARFRSDCQALLTREAIEACVMPGVVEQPPLSGITYQAFIDFAGGSGADSLTLAVAHGVDDLATLDYLFEKRPPFSPSAVMAEVIEICRRYNVTTVRGDHWGGQFPREYLEVADIHYEVSVKPKSALYSDLLPLINSTAAGQRRVALLDHPRLMQQFVGLERHVARGGKDSIDHGPGQHDDCSNSVAGALLMAKANSRPRMLLGGLPSRFGQTVAEVFDAFARRVNTDKDAKRPDGTPYTQPLSGAARRSALEQLRDGAKQTAVGKEICGLMWDEDSFFRDGQPPRGPQIERHPGLY